MQEPAKAKQVDARTFESEVVERSHQKLIVVDFWAPWCGPCHALAPLLEQVIDKHSKDAALVKVNIDEAPDLAARFRVSGIPMVIAFSEGKTIGEFVGVQPQHVIDSWIRGLLGQALDHLLKRAHQLADQPDQKQFDSVIQELELALEQQNDPRISLELARLFALQGKNEDARRWLQQVEQGTPEWDTASSQLKLLDLLDDSKQSAGELESERSADGADSEARLKRAGRLWRENDHAGAMEQLLQIVRQDRDYRDGVARQLLLACFELLGEHHPQVQSARNELGMILFS